MANDKVYVVAIALDSQWQRIMKAFAATKLGQTMTLR